MGVARLSVRHVAALLKAIDDDAQCGFQSAAAKASVTMSGAPGDDGSATWTVRDCTLRFEPEVKLDTDCGGHELWVHGTATVSAVRTVRGVLTADPTQPVAPDRADAATVELQATFDGLQVRDSLSSDTLTVKSGALRVVATPLLAPGAPTGICTVPTGQLGLSALTLSDAELEVVAYGHRLTPSVPSAHLNAQVGLGAQHENWLQGDVTVWETLVQVPTPDGPTGLDPSYDRDAFVRSFACRAGLQQPLGAACSPPRERGAQGAAMLSVQLFGVVARQIDQDTRCGFATTGLAVVPSGSIGNKGTAVWTLPAPCLLSFAPGTVVETDCAGVQTVLEGTVTVAGTKSVRGWLTGDPAEPVVPASSSPATLQLELTFADLRLTQPGSLNRVWAKGGVLRGTLEPRMALSKKARACSIATPVAHLMLEHVDTVLEVDRGSTSVSLTLSHSMLEAQSGSAGGKTNYFAGTLTVGGQQISVPSAGAAPVLDPQYQAAAFQASYMCDPDLSLPAAESECSFARPLAEGAARLLVRDAAAVVQGVNADSRCGFQNQNLLENPSSVTGRPGQMGSMGWSANCALDQGLQHVYQTDCRGAQTTIEGRASAQLNRVVDGQRGETCGGPFNLTCVETITPLKPDAVTFDVRAVTFDNFGVGSADGRLLIHTGSLTTTARTMQGQRRSNGHYDVATPVGGLSSLALSNANLTLQVGPKTFSFAVASSNLTAFNGAFGSEKNSLSGSLSVDGELVDLGALELQPNYSQTQFDAAYACTPDLTAPLVP
jgi:hypothetical protein